MGEGGGNRGLREALGEGNVLAGSHVADPPEEVGPISFILNRCLGGVGNIRHVERHGVLVVDGDIGREGDATTRSDRDDGGVGAAGAADVAAEIWGREICRELAGWR